jgi:glycerate dehydrogenase
MKIICIASDVSIDNYMSPLTTIGDLIIHHKQNLTPVETIELLKDADILIAGPESVGNISAEILTQLPNLKFISLLTIGTGWVDLAFCSKKGISVSNIGGATAESVAEHTWAMILSLAKRVSEFDRASRTKGDYNFANYKGKEVFGKTMGIIGLGNIGKEVARIASAFSMKILGLHTSNIPVPGVSLVSQEQLLKESDIVALCIPLNDSTIGYISEKEIAQMKDGVILVNCAREKLVDKESLVTAVKSRKIFGYGVETDIMKEIPKDDDYYQLDNVIVTPHNAFNTVEADDRSYKVVVENIQSFLSGNPQNIVTN